RDQLPAAEGAGRGEGAPMGTRKRAEGQPEGGVAPPRVPVDPGAERSQPLVQLNAGAEEEDGPLERGQPEPLGQAVQRRAPDRRTAGPGAVVLGTGGAVRRLFEAEAQVVELDHEAA